MASLFRYPKRRLKKMLRNGEYAEAIEFGKSLEHRFSDDFDFMFIMGGIYLIVEEREKALAIL